MTVFTKKKVALFSNNANLKSLVTVILVFTSLLGYGQKLSLKEKEFIAGLDFSWYEKSILNHYGSAVTIEVNQLSFAGSLDALQFVESRGANAVTTVIGQICSQSPVGKQALQEKKIKKVILQNDKVNAPKVTIDKGVMTIVEGYATEKYLTDQALRDAIENLL